MSYSLNSQHSQRTPRRKGRLLLIVGLVLIAVIVTGIVWANSGNKATINNPNNVAPVVRAAAFKPYVGKYVSFQYQDIYQEKARDNSLPGVEQILLRANTSYEKTIAIEVQPLPQNGVAADTGYNYRQLHPELYLDQHITVAGSQATEWVKKDGAERTIYVLHGNQYAVISLSVDRTNDTSHLQDEETALLQSFHWK
jgi:hypothetical protein